MDTVKYFLIGTPWWVYLIFVYLVFIGIKSVKGGVIHIRKLFVIPIIFLYMSVTEVSNNLHLNTAYIITSLVGLALGACLGWWQFKMLKIQVDQTKKLLKIEGSWFALFLIIITFIVKYYVGYSLAVNHNMSLNFTCGLLLVSSIFTGAFIGRLLYGIYKLNAGPHVDLIK